MLLDFGRIDSESQGSCFWRWWWIVSYCSWYWKGNKGRYPIDTFSWFKATLFPPFSICRCRRHSITPPFWLLSFLFRIPLLFIRSKPRSWILHSRHFKPSDGCTVSSSCLWSTFTANHSIHGRCTNFKWSSTLVRISLSPSPHTLVHLYSYSQERLGASA